MGGAGWVIPGVRMGWLNKQSITARNTGICPSGSAGHDVPYRKPFAHQEIAMFMHRFRRGTSVVQWVVVAALLTLALVAGVTVMGSRTNTKLNQTASDVGNPSALTQRFGS